MRSLGDVLKGQGFDAAAVSAYERCLPVARQVGDRLDQSYALTNLAMLANVRQDYPLSARYAGEALAMFRAMGDPVQQPFVQRMLGYAAARAGQFGEARQRILESLRGNQALNDLVGVSACLVALADLAAAQGDGREALRLAGAADAARQEAGAEWLAPDAAAYQRLVGQSQGASFQPRETERKAAWQSGVDTPLAEILADLLLAA